MFTWQNTKRAVRVSVLVLAVAAAGAPGTVLCQSSDTTSPEVGRCGKAFKGGEGELVELSRVGPAAAGAFLVKVSRVDHPWDGIVHKVKAIDAGNGSDYTLESGGERRNLIVERGSESKKSYRLYLEGGTQVDLRYDEELSKALVPEHLLTAYLAQEKERAKKEAKLSR